MKHFPQTLLFILFLSINTFAATFTVNQTGDAGDLTCDATCTLRDAIDDANASSTDDTILFAANINTTTLANEIVINNAGTLTIIGNGANVLTIDGGAGTNRIFYTNLATVTITGVTLTGGNGIGLFNNRFGGAIFAQGGTLVLNSVYVTSNSSVSGAVYFNSGINHQILNSTFSANTALNCGGFVTFGGILAVTNSTVSGNSAENSGGGFCNNGGSTTFRNVTFTANSARGGGGILVGGSLNLGNTIVAGNVGVPQDVQLFAGTVRSDGYNLIGDNDNVTTEFPAGHPNSNNDIVGTTAEPVNPLLGPLQNNGGTTPTHALLFGSPAIDEGNNCVFLASCPSGVPAFALLTDQRGAGFTRSADGNEDTIQIVDIGAFELQLAPTAATVQIGGRVITSNGEGIGGIIVTIADTFEGRTRSAVTNAQGYYQFADVRAGGTYVLSVFGKGYNFAQPSQVLSLTANAEINFIALQTKSRKRLRSF